MLVKTHRGHWVCFVHFDISIYTHSNVIWLFHLLLYCIQFSISAYISLFQCIIYVCHSSVPKSDCWLSTNFVIVHIVKLLVVKIIQCWQLISVKVCLHSVVIVFPKHSFYPDFPESVTCYNCLHSLNFCVRKFRIFEQFNFCHFRVC